MPRSPNRPAHTHKEQSRSARTPPSTFPFLHHDVKERAGCRGKATPAYSRDEPETSSAAPDGTRASQLGLVQDEDDAVPIRSGNRRRSVPEEPRESVSRALRFVLARSGVAAWRLYGLTPALCQPPSARFHSRQEQKSRSQRTRNQTALKIRPVGILASFPGNPAPGRRLLRRVLTAE